MRLKFQLIIFRTTNSIIYFSSAEVFGHTTWKSCFSIDKNFTAFVLRRTLIAWGWPVAAVLAPTARAGVSSSANAFSTLATVRFTTAAAARWSYVEIRLLIDIYYICRSLKYSWREPSAARLVKRTYYLLLLQIIERYVRQRPSIRWTRNFLGPIWNRSWHFEVCWSSFSQKALRVGIEQIEDTACTTNSLSLAFLLISWCLIVWLGLDQELSWRHLRKLLQWFVALSASLLSNH